MKKLVKTIVCFVTMLVCAVCCLGLVGCDKKQQIEIKLSIYDYTTSEFVDRTLTIDLNGQIAPKTVEAIINNVNNKYYQNALFYKHENYSAQMMFGDLVYSEGTLIQNPIAAPQVKGEFAANGLTTDAPIKHKEGSVSLWRNYHGGDKDSYKTSSGANTGRGTWMMPIDSSSVSGYDGYFAAFGTIDIVDNNENFTTFSQLKNVIKMTDNSNTEQYTVYYTGTYNTDDSVANNGLQFHCVKAEDFGKLSQEEQDSVFDPSKDLSLKAYGCYAKANYRVALVNKGKSNETPAIKLVSIAVK